MSGKLYIVATPIGNLEDITMRALRILGEVELIAAEDTRRARKLLSHYDIKTKCISYHTHNEHYKTDSLLQDVLNGTSLVVLSDAGTPCIADPGFLIIREAIKLEIEPIIIPGVSSLTFSACAAGLPVDCFAFYGFIPVKIGRRTKMLEKIKTEDKTVFIFESPHRMSKLLLQISEIISPTAQVAVIREATKIYEEVIRGSASDLAEQYKDKKWKGECVVGISSKE